MFEKYKYAGSVTNQWLEDDVRAKLIESYWLYLQNIFTSYKASLSPSFVTGFGVLEALQAGSAWGFWKPKQYL